MRVREVFSQKATGDLGAEIIITSAKRIVKSEGADEKSAGGFSQNSTGALGEKNIITAGEQNVKSEGADEKSAGDLGEQNVKFEEVDEKTKDNSLQERSMDLEIIITDVK